MVHYTVIPFNTALLWGTRWMVFISNSHKKLQKKKSMGLKKEIPLWAFICRHLLLGKMRYLDTLVSIHLPCSFRPRGKAAAHREPQACLAALKRSATLTEGCDSFGEALGEHAALATALKRHRVQRAPSSSKFILNRARKGERSQPSRAGTRWADPRETSRRNDVANYRHFAHKTS